MANHIVITWIAGVAIVLLSTAAVSKATDAGEPQTIALKAFESRIAGQVEEAAKQLDPLAEKSPAPPELKVALARLELRRGNDDKAEKHLRGALEVSPQKGAILFELGRLYERQGKLTQALECYRTALEEAYPTNS